MVEARFRVKQLVSDRVRVAREAATLLYSGEER